MSTIKIAIAGGTGLVGAKLAETLTGAGHEPVVLSRSSGVNVVSGAGLDAALEGVSAVVDVTSTPATEPAETRAFFEAATRNLLGAERRHGVGHHLALSIVGVDRIRDNAHYLGKQAQEQVIRNEAEAWTILRATQFFEFPEMVVGWTRQGGTATLPPLLIQPVAADDVAIVLAELAVAGPQRRVIDLAGPETQDFVDMARRALAARGDTGTRLVPSWGGPFGVEMAGEALLPEGEARIAPTTFDQWLAALSD